MRTPHLLALTTLVLVLGCEKPSQNANPLASESGGSTTKPTATTGDKVETTPLKIKISDDVKHEAYDYYGLAMTDPVEYEMTQQGQPPQRGSQITALEGAEKGEYHYYVTRTGALEGIGSTRVRLDSKGIYVVSGTNLKIDKPELELPSRFAPGTTWQGRTVDAEGRTNLKLTYKVVGKKPVKTPVGAYSDALVVTASGAGTYNGVPATLNATQWFARGRGVVKAEYRIKLKTSALPQKAELMEVPAEASSSSTNGQP